MTHAGLSPNRIKGMGISFNKMAPSHHGLIVSLRVLGCFFMCLCVTDCDRFAQVKSEPRRSFSSSWRWQPIFCFVWQGSLLPSACGRIGSHREKTIHSFQFGSKQAESIYLQGTPRTPRLLSGPLSKADCYELMAILDGFEAA